ncbi:MAG: hypothetical protein AAGG44_11020 [Planctomycetota bacterium]
MPNLVAAHELVSLEDAVYVGGQPEGKAAFQQLRQLGIQTIVSVDGARPDLDLARQFQMRYVHVPLRYSGVDPEQCLNLAATLRLYEGPFYFHCHHGRHRAPAAAACALISAGKVSSTEGIRLLKAAGTGKDYLGLWASVRDGTEILDLEDRLPNELPSIAETNPFADSMAQLSRLADRWETLISEPTENSAPRKATKEKVAELSLLIRECFEEATRASILPEKYQTDPFRKRLLVSKRLAERLEAASRTSDATSLYQRLRSECKSCHQRYRN